jgi:hypothetical protein
MKMVELINEYLGKTIMCGLEKRLGQNLSFGFEFKKRAEFVDAG